MLVIKLLYGFNDLKFHRYDNQDFKDSKRTINFNTCEVKSCQVILFTKPLSVKTL